MTEEEHPVITSADRPPLLRTLLIFIAGLALITGLAALTYAPEAEAPTDITSRPDR